MNYKTVKNLNTVQISNSSAVIIGRRCCPTSSGQENAEAWTGSVTRVGTFGKSSCWQIRFADDRPHEILSVLTEWCLAPTYHRKVIH